MEHVGFLKSLLELRGKSVVDVGAGDGEFSKQLAREGAIVTAVEVDPEKVERARTALPPGVRVLLGRAETLPLEDHTQDIACYFFSLHHVPENVQAAAFDEACRILKSGGRLHIVEPYPDGTMFDVVRLVEDETHVRTRSHALLRQLGDGAKFRLLASQEYVLTREYPTFEAFVGRIVNPDPDRRARFSSVAREMEETFNRVADVAHGARVLHQPCAAYHFQA